MQARLPTIGRAVEQETPTKCLEDNTVAGDRPYQEAMKGIPVNEQS